MKSGLHLFVCAGLCLLLGFIFEERLFADAKVTTIGQLNNLFPNPAAEPVPLQLEGTVVCFDAGWHQLYLHDGQDTSYFNADDFSIQPQLGQRVEISGQTRGSNLLSNLRLTILGNSTLPSPKTVKLSQLSNYHGAWIETTGRGLSAETSRGRLALLLHDSGQNCLAFVLGSPVTNDFKNLIGASVRLRGINASKTKGSLLESGVIFVPGIQQVSILSSDSGERPQIPVTSIGGLLNRELGNWTNQWVHINGLVSSYQVGQSLIVRDPTGILRAQVIQMTEIGVDARVDVWGFLEVGEDESFLKNAWFEVVRPRPAPILVPSPSISSTSTPGRETLTKIADVLKLSREEAAGEIPVLLHGVITYADPEWRIGFLQDQSTAIYIDLDPSQKTLQSGQWVELKGRTSPGGFAPEVLTTEIHPLGSTNLPNPVISHLEEFANGHLDAHWVEMRGVVRRVDSNPGRIILGLKTPEGGFKAMVLDSGEKTPAANLVGALVSVQGACTSEPNSRRQVSGITLHAPSFAQVRVIEPPPADPFAITSSRIDAIATFRAEGAPDRLIRVKGIITVKMPGQGFILQDDSGGIRVQSRELQEINTGDLMDVVGFPAIGDFSPSIEEASFRKIGVASLPTATKTSAEQILLLGTNDNQLIELKGRLLQNVPRSANPQLVLQDGPTIFSAQLTAQKGRMEIPPLQSGSLLQLTGVCSIQGGEDHEPKAFRLLLSQPTDIQLLETPPWWTARHTFMLVGGLVVAISATLAWVGLLRSRVEAQTTMIRQKLQDEAALEERFRDLFENANDMLYTHDCEGQLTSINQTGERLLQRKRSEILNRNLLEFIVQEQKSAARQWLDAVLKRSSTGTVEWDFLTPSGHRLKLEISTRSMEKGGRLQEVEGIARDITERKRLELEILEISNREQRRIGHDLHDGVCQQLAGIAFMTSTLADELQEKGVAESIQAEKISTLLHAAVDQTKGVARGLFPARLEQNGLVSTLEELSVNASDLFKIQCRFVAEDPPPYVENGIALHLYYIVLEAIANASKHGNARNVQITLNPVGDRYQLSVQDDGVGFVRDTVKQTGMGLPIMQYRARVIGATLTMQSKHGCGTDIVCLFLPMSREKGAHNHDETLNPAFPIEKTFA